MNPYISIDYDEFHPETYRGVTVSHDNIGKRFFSGDAERDMRAANDWAFARSEHVNKSSSVDNFFSDVKRGR